MLKCYKNNNNNDNNNNSNKTNFIETFLTKLLQQFYRITLHSEWYVSNSNKSNIIILIVKILRKSK